MVDVPSSAPGVDNGLLDFVSALDNLDVPEDEETFETFADLDAKTEKKSKPKKKKVAKLENDASVDDFTAVIENDDSGFTGLKKKMSVIQGKEEGSRVKVVEAPLPTYQQSEIDRSVAYEKTAKDVSKWAPVVQKNRDAERLVFPLPEQEASVNISSHTLVSSFTPVTDMEKEITGLINRDGITPKVMAADDTISLEADTLPTVRLDPDQLYREMSKARSSKFFAEIKAKRQAKIKSKMYRKMLKKERMRAEAEAIASGNLSELARLGLASSAAEDDEIRREKRMKAEMERARERLTLRTRKVNQWARDLMIHKHGDADGRLQVLEQIREKERLRQEIYGTSDKFGDEEDDDDEESQHESDVSEAESELEINDDASAEVQGIFDDVKAEHAIVTGRHKFGPTEEEDTTQYVENNSDSDQEFEAELNKSIVKKAKVTVKTTKSVEIEDDVNQESDDDFESGNTTEIKWKSQASLVREAFADDDVFAEFKSEKDATVDAEAPKVEDVTLPGWGVWGGAGISEEKSKGKTRVLMHKKGLDPKARLDKDLKHVIINERRIKAAAKAFTIPSVPFPFTSPEMHASHIAQPIGKEWNTVTSYRKRIQPRVTAKAGSVIKPIKFFKQANNV